MKRCLIFFAILATVATKSAFDYCTLNCHENGNEVKHVGCDHNGEFGPKCWADAELIVLKEAEKKIILREYNKLRNFVAGGGDGSYEFKPACRMATLQWDDGLADVSVLFSKTCQIYRTHSCLGTSNFPNTSQILYGPFIRLRHADAINCLKFAFEWYNQRLLTRRDKGDVFVDSNTHVGCSGIYTAKTKETKFAEFSCIHSIKNPSSGLGYAECERPATGCETGPNPEFPNLCSEDEVY